MCCGTTNFSLIGNINYILLHKSFIYLSLSFLLYIVQETYFTEQSCEVPYWPWMPHQPVKKLQHVVLLPPKQDLLRQKFLSFCHPGYTTPNFLPTLKAKFLPFSDNVHIIIINLLQCNARNGSSILGASWFHRLYFLLEQTLTERKSAVNKDYSNVANCQFDAT